MKERIKEGKTQYCCELGFINWDHAMPERTAEAFHVLQRLNSVSKDTFHFAYMQKMNFKIGGINLVAMYGESRKIPPHLSPSEERKVFLEIFCSVSRSFENMQGELPFALLAEGRASSFRNGDLMGDWLSYYSAVSGRSLAEIKKDLSLLPADAIPLNEEKSENIDWNILFLNSRKPNTTIDGLREIIRSAEKYKRDISIKTDGCQELSIKMNKAGFCLLF